MDGAAETEHAPPRITSTRRERLETCGVRPHAGRRFERSSRQICGPRVESIGGEMVDSKCPRTRRGVVCRPRGGAEVETERGEKRAWDAPRERECNTKHVKGRASTVSYTRIRRICFQGGVHCCLSRCTCNSGRFFVPMRGGFPAFLLAGARCLRRAAREAARGHAVTSHAGSARAARRAARKQRKKKNGQRSSSALQPIKSPECRHASAQKTRSNYSAKGSSEPLPSLDRIT